MPQASPIQQHNEEIQQNLLRWQAKPLLRLVYRHFHQMLARQVLFREGASVVELGSGIPDISQAVPGCIRTDIFPSPWIDQIENAYRLSFPDNSVGTLILFDVFHHLRYPGTAMREFRRVLQPGGRVIIFDPCLSWLGKIVYGRLHHEPLGLEHAITWEAPAGWDAAQLDYYAAQGNAFRIFVNREIDIAAQDWKLLHSERRSCLSYVLSGGYSMPQVYPTAWLPLMEKIDSLADYLPGLFATRLLVVLEKTGSRDNAVI